MQGIQENRFFDTMAQKIESITRRVVTTQNKYCKAIDGDYDLDLNDKTYRYNNRSRRDEATEADIIILKKARLIACTTTRAARDKDILKQVSPSIFLIEEAAEIPEHHVVACLTSSCRQLIMIGDHQQLRPSYNDYKTAQEHKINISLFERLIDEGFPSTQLEYQHRMRPSISKLLVPHIYENLKNDTNVSGYENVKGIHCDMFLNSHSVFEDQDHNTISKSHKNRFEALFICELYRYLRIQGYESSEITVLSTYLDQVRLLRDSIGKVDEELSRTNAWFSSEQSVRVETVDNFQGEENKIILLSLVRNSCERCNVFVEKTIPKCQHVKSMPCHINPQLESCGQRCQASMNCGHQCNKTCKDNCSTEDSCKKKIQVKARCGHEVQVECSTKYDASCKLQCSGILNCGHKCKGTHSECSQGRLHVPCYANCERNLVYEHDHKDHCSYRRSSCMNDDTCKTRVDGSKLCKGECKAECPNKFKCDKSCMEPCEKLKCNTLCEPDIQDKNIMNFCPEIRRLQLILGIHTFKTELYARDEGLIFPDIIENFLLKLESIEIMKEDELSKMRKKQKTFLLE
ncbi:unnamed protein product [Mytilus edulis]|uniref:NFX1-type zinc finger-containing protein 1 n=1 Tax=Mytilus edulis TaxID=6550 RepID=A0A8S3QGL3_MYTED|nr:unnamed protein product [Mytilus edulis]